MVSGKIIVLAVLCAVLTFVLVLDFSIVTSMLQGHGTKVFHLQKTKSQTIEREFTVDHEHSNLDIVSSFRGRTAQVPTNYRFFPPNYVPVFKSWDQPSIVDVHDDNEWLPGKRPRSLPRDFNWQDYFRMNPDVALRMPNTAQGAARHFVNGGFREGRVYSRLGVKLRYSKCPPAGVMTQHYTHIAAAVLATVLGADLVLPAAWMREPPKYAGEKPVWKAAPFNNLWDAEYIHELWATQRQNFTTRDLRPYELDPARVVDILVPMDPPPWPLPFRLVMELVRGQAASRAGEVFQRADAYTKVYLPMLVELPCPLHLVPFYDQPLASKVAREFKFNPALQALADSIVKALKQQVPDGYNGLHITGVESNKTGDMQLASVDDPYWSIVFQTCMAAEFQPSSLVYVASDLLLTNDFKIRKQISALLAPISGRIAHQSLFLHPQQLAALGPEQRTLVDFLVLTQCNRYVGPSDNHFSKFVREYRHLMGIAPRTTSVLIHPDSNITDPDSLQPALWFP